MSRRAWWARPLTVVQAVAAGVALARLAGAARREPPLAPGQLDVRPGEHRPTVSVVIPARDEAARIGPCLEALALDPQVHEVIVVDDESTDGTAALAARSGARVLRGTPLPAGWVGKQWALWQGIRAARGEWVITLDADTRPEPGLAGAAVDAALTRGYDLLTLGVRFECRSPAEQVLHPAMLTSLVYRFGVPGPHRRPRPDRVLANGQCMVFRRALLADGQALRAVRGHLTDEIALVRWLARRGRRIGFLDGSRLLTTRMHTSAAEAWREWGRSLALPGATGPVWQAADLAVVWLTLALPQLRLLTGRVTPLDALLLTVRAGTAVSLARSYTPPSRWAWLAPLADVPVAVRLTWSAVRPTRTWRGRTYPAAGPADPGR